MKIGLLEGLLFFRAGSWNLPPSGNAEILRFDSPRKHPGCQLGNVLRFQIGRLEGHPIMKVGSLEPQDFDKRLMSPSLLAG